MAPLIRAPLAVPRRLKARWMVVAALAVVIASAATTTVFGRGQFDQLASALGTNKSLKLTSGTVARASFGGPQTLLLIGNDQRKHTTTTPVLPHANEMLLVRIDPGKPWISMMSIPRELDVPIHTPDSGIVTTRLNAALQFGGINLVVNTIKQVTGLSVNHVVEIDFGNFERAVNEMGCVYGMIDRRYYHVNVPGGQQYFQVNLHPGYQKLCGSQALQFVTYRHGDTALVRDARDQTFLLEVKQQFGPTLIDNIGKFEHIFGQTVQTDSSLHSANGVEDLVGTLISVAGLPVRQVPFRVQPVDVPCAGSTCILATPSQIRASAHSFLYGSGKEPAKKSTAGLAHAIQRTGAKFDVRGQIVPVPGAQIAYARLQARALPFPLEMPSVEVNNGLGYPIDIRDYKIPAPGGQSYPIYDAVFSTGLLGQYYDVQGTRWLTAPLLDDPDQSITVGGRTYYVYYSGQNITQVAWFANNAAYWVRNTLTSGLTNAQLLAIAERTTPVLGADAGSVRSDARHQTAAPSSVVVRSSSDSTLHVVGAIGGVIALLASVAGVLLLVLQRLRLGSLRADAGVAASRITALEKQLGRLRVATPSDGAPTPGVAPLAPVTAATRRAQARAARKAKAAPASDRDGS